ncbi:hypothetical protein AB0D83_02050 [Streptomyces decoyicus]|uniref:hypothetical protein n=1 Tax=Streptomyces decoyicus TaxID=249567 RepID=UPI0033E46C67
MDHQSQGHGHHHDHGCRDHRQRRPADPCPPSPLPNGAGHIHPWPTGPLFEIAQRGEQLGRFPFQFIVVHGRYASLMDAADAGS